MYGLANWVYELVGKYAANLPPPRTLTAELIFKLGM